MCLFSENWYYGNLDGIGVTDNKTFRKTNKPFLSDKIVLKEKLTLIVKGEIFESDFDTVQTLNTFFSIVVSNIKIAEYANCDPTSDNINDPVIKSIVKYRNHPTILKIGEVCRLQPDSLFFFAGADRQQMLKEILSLDSAKESQDTDIPIKIIEENADIFSDFHLSSFHLLFRTSTFLSRIKKANITSVFKKGDKHLKEMIGQLAYYQISRRCSGVHIQTIF